MHQITIRYPSGKSVAFPSGIKAIDATQGFGPLAHPLAAVLVNNQLQSLDAQILTNCVMEPVLIDSTQGAFSYRRSLCFLAAIAARDIFPNRDLIVVRPLAMGSTTASRAGPCQRTI
ncbi:hypothetical protein MASR2M48_20550 [Spirochaetota bacterium]